MTISQLKAELEKGPQEAAVYTQQIHELKSNLLNLQQQSQVTHTHAHTPSQITALWLSAHQDRSKRYIILHRPQTTGQRHKLFFTLTE